VKIPDGPSGIVSGARVEPLSGATGGLIVIAWSSVSSCWWSTSRVGVPVDCRVAGNSVGVEAILAGVWAKAVWTLTQFFILTLLVSYPPGP
jgi:hypothetical protein